MTARERLAQLEARCAAHESELAMWRVALDRKAEQREAGLRLVEEQGKRGDAWRDLAYRFEAALRAARACLMGGSSFEASLLAARDVIDIALERKDAP